MAENERPVIRAKVTNEVVDYPHNDIANAAYFFRERLSEAFDKNERREGLFLDMMALITMTAFALEGYVNLIGSRLIERCVTDSDRAAEAWGAFERKRTRQKIKSIRKATGILIDWNKRPYVTVSELIDLRNMFAHPKPHRPEKREYEAVGTDSELKQLLRDYRPEYEARLTWNFACRAYEDVEQIWQELLDAAKIDRFDTMSGGTQGLQLLAWVNPDGSETLA